jgi:formamidopyrimidine-DNA glycosylase
MDKIAARKASIKALLLDQSVVAGIGNIYADEALYRAGVHPGRSGNSLQKREIEKLYTAIQTVLQLGIEQKGSSLQNYVRLDGLKGSFQDQHQVFRKTGQPCPTCGHPIERILIAQRSTHFCPHCQPI